MSGQRSISAIVPTMGLSPYLEECLARLRRDGGSELEIVVIAQGAHSGEIDSEHADVVLREPENLGFAEACNKGIETASGELVALVNDDALIEPGWFAELRNALADAPSHGAAQGVNVQLDRPDRMDGCGIGWNWAWRPVQLGFGAPTLDRDEAPREIFGVSATACLYRRSALERVELDRSNVFETVLRSYYEDVELAVRLRRAGITACLVPAARCGHAGSTTSRQMPAERVRLLYSNRYLVSARLFGERFQRGPVQLLMLRDLIDILGALVTLRAATVRSIVRAWGRARRLMTYFRHAGDAALSPEQLSPFRVGRAGSYR